MSAIECHICGRLRKLGSYSFPGDPVERLHECFGCGDPERWEDTLEVIFQDLNART